MADARQRYLQMPMPPGWEVKYDFSSRKYFFIDHNTKNTAWEDPRPAYYMRQERQQAQPSPQTSSSRFSQAVTSLNSGRNLSSSSPARRPETIQLQQVPKETEIDDMPTLGEDEYEFAVLESKFPNATKDEITAALKSAKTERPDRAGGQIGRATDILRQQATINTKAAEKERELASKCRSLSADFPQISSTVILSILREVDGNMYKTKEKLSKTQALIKKYPNVQSTLIIELQKEAAARSEGEAFIEQRLQFLQSEATPAAASGSNTPARQRHPSPKPLSVQEGEDSLERQRAHRQLVNDLMREFPKLERALVRSVLASVNWSLQKGREKLQTIQASGSGNTERSASPASSTASALSPIRSRGPSPHPSTSSAQVTSPMVSVVKPSTKTKKPVAKPKSAPKAKPKPKTVSNQVITAPKQMFSHQTLAIGPNPMIRVGPDQGLKHGPDPTIRRGPDPSLRSGRDIQLVQGCNPDLLSGVRTRD